MDLVDCHRNPKKNDMRIGCVLFGSALLLYTTGVILQREVVRLDPSIARLFYPPFFQYSETFASGRVGPFAVGMSDQEVVAVANRNRLSEFRCNASNRVEHLPVPPLRCFSRSAAGVYWQLYYRENTVARARVYTNLNLEI